MTKPTSSFPRPLADLLRKTLNEGFARQGFTSSEIVTRWPEIIGPDIAQHCEPIKIQWPRGPQDDPQPATLVLRVEGPAALEIQHMSSVILERVNRFFGWQAVGQIAIRQAPLRGRPHVAPPMGPDPEKTAKLAAELRDIVADDELRGALARLGASVKRK
jgi:hypothetical protein